MPHALRKKLSQRLGKLGVEERAWPGRDDGFASLSFGGKEFGHFHSDCEIDLRLGKEIIARERLVHPKLSTVHPDRAKGSPWYELKVSTAADVDEAVRLVQLAIDSLPRKR